MIFAKLNEEQKIAVQHDGNVLLTACPGSGKTRVIIHKLAHELSLLDEKSKRKIVALTFTVRASEEILRRLNEMGVNSNKIWSGTLHSFCLDWIVKPYACYLPELSNGFSIADESFCTDTISTLKKEFGILQRQAINTRINREGSFIEQGIVQQKLLAKYHKILKSKKLIDFDMLLFYSYRILELYPKIPKTLSNIFKLICVDEYQDTQDILYGIISLIVKSGNGHSTIFLVGDADQAIYGSLGGVAKTLEEIRLEFGNILITPLTLSGNYRSTQRIIDFYTHFQSQQISIKAFGKNASEIGLITLNSSIDQTQIVAEVARLIQLNLNNGISEDEICVLVPQWWLISSITKQLRAALPNVNFDASGLTPMSRNRENIWYKLSRLFLTQPHPRIYSLRYRWADELIDNFKILTHSDLKDDYSNARNLLRLVNTIKSFSTDGIEYLNDCFDQFLMEMEIDYPSFPTLIDNRIAFFDNIENRLNDQNYSFPRDIDSFKSFYREISGVVINTCVGVKGEEFDTVIAYGLLYGYIPHWNAIYSNGAIDPTDAANKLLYVICSRAKQNLHLISETGRTTISGVRLTITPTLENNVFDYDEY